MPEVVAGIKSFFSRHDVPVYVAPEKDPLHVASLMDEIQKWPQIVDLAIVVVVTALFKGFQRARPYNLPILGINLGHKGFLAEIEIDKLSYFMEKLVNGDYGLVNG